MLIDEGFVLTQAKEINTYELETPTGAIEVRQVKFNRTQQPQVRKWEYWEAEKEDYTLSATSEDELIGKMEENGWLS